MVTVASGRNDSRTLSVASRVMVPSAISSPEQDTRPTLCFGSSGILFLRGDVIGQIRDFLSQDAGKFMPGLVELGDSGGLQMTVPSIHVEHLEGARNRSARFGDYLCGTGKLAPVDCDCRGSPQHIAHGFVPEDDERQGHEPRTLRAEVLRNDVGAFARHGAVSLADAAAGYDECLPCHFFSSASA